MKTKVKVSHLCKDDLQAAFWILTGVCPSKKSNTDYLRRIVRKEATKALGDGRRAMIGMGVIREDKDRDITFGCLR